MSIFILMGNLFNANNIAIVSFILIAICEIKIAMQYMPEYDSDWFSMLMILHIGITWLFINTIKDNLCQITKNLLKLTTSLIVFVSVCLSIVLLDTYLSSINTISGNVVYTLASSLFFAFSYFCANCTSKTMNFLFLILSLCQTLITYYILFCARY